jgi:protein TonB
MEPKKNPNIDLGQTRHLFFFVGMSIALLLSITAFEWKSYETSIVDLTGLQSDPFEEAEIIRTIQPPPEPPKPKLIDPIIEIVPDDIEIDEIEFEIDNDPLEDLSNEIPFVEMPPEEVIEIFEGIVEEMPEPNGGYKAFYSFLSRNMKYPRTAKNLGMEGRVFLQFVVDEKGEITDIKVIKGIGSGCDEEAKRVLALSPKWKPGKQRGRSVKVRMVIPVVFKLSN